ncbi:Triggering receptor expressed on myeloid cells 2, partial [Varanus komodoensis]
MCPSLAAAAAGRSNPIVCKVSFFPDGLFKCKKLRWRRDDSPKIFQSKRLSMRTCSFRISAVAEHHVMLPPAVATMGMAMALLPDYRTVLNQCLTVHPFFHVIDEKIKQHRTQDRALGDPACHWQPSRRFPTNGYPLLSMALGEGPPLKIVGSSKTKELPLCKSGISFLAGNISCLIGWRGMEKFVHLIFLVSFSEASATEKVELVHGIEGKSISINCTYNPKENQWRQKSWCKHTSERECQHIVSARRFWMPFLKKRNGSTAIADNIQDGILTVTINPLQKKDAGVYQCKSEFLGSVDTLQTVELNVLAGLWETETPEEPRVAHSVSSCLYLKCVHIQLPASCGVVFVSFESTPSSAEVKLYFLVAGFLGFKLLVAVVILMIARSKKSRATGVERRREMGTCHFTLSKAYTPPISEPFFLARPSNARSPEEVQVEKGMSLKITTFCEHKYFQGDKIWCREKHLKECDLKGPLSHSRSGWRYLTAQPNQKILLQHSTNGCVSLLMTNLQVEDSGIYWFGLLEGLEIVSSNKIKVVVHEGHIVPSRTVSPPTSSIPYFKSSKQENIEEVMKVKINCCSYKRYPSKLTKYMLVPRVCLIYTVDCFRVYHVVLVLGSIMVGITIIAALACIAAMIIKRKTRATADLNFGDNPNCKVITLQINESKAANKPVDTEMKPVYAILKKPQSSMEDVTYVNMRFPLRSNIKHCNKPPDAFSPSVSVKYANISFEP